MPYSHTYKSLAYIKTIMYVMYVMYVCAKKLYAYKKYSMVWYGMVIIMYIIMYIIIGKFV
jgi:hypothetical protein